MPLGPGKYDPECTALRLHLEAQAVILIVLNGSMGSGFSVQVKGADITAQLPALLRNMANDIEASLK